MIKKPLLQVTLCLKMVLLLGSAVLAFQDPMRLPPRPKPVTPVVPIFPPIARAACVEGTVTVIVEVDSMGKVTKSDVLYGHPLL